MRAHEERAARADLLPRLAVLALITQIQLALRHPENKGWNALQGALIGRELHALFEKDSATYQILEKGWDEKFDCTVVPTAGITEVHNVYTLYEIEKNGDELKQRLLTFFRPQDWGNPTRWHYHYYCIRIDRYVNHCHVWQQVKRNPFEAMQLIASNLFIVMIPGVPKELCSRSHLATDDFWDEDWGEMPPYYRDEEEEEC